MPTRRHLRRVLAAAGVAAVLGCGLVAPASAGPGAATAPYYPVPAGDFAVPRTVGGLVGDAVALWRNGSATTTVDLPGPAVRFVLDVYAQQCQGAPRLDVRIDGVGVWGREIAGSGQYAVAGSWAPGRHTVKLVFSRDKLEAGCDRNLKVAEVGWWGPHPRYGAVPAFVHQHLDLPTVAFAPAPAGAASASGAALWTSGSMTGRLDSQAGDYLYVELETPVCAGAPSLQLRVDGEVAETAEFSPETDGSRRAYYLVGDWADRTHTVEISYLDPGRTAGCDPYVRLTQLSFSGYV